MSPIDDVIIVGAGIGGLTLGARAAPAPASPAACIEAAAEIRPVGVGINLLPHATQELAELGLEAGARARRGARPRKPTFFNRFGQLIYQRAARPRCRLRRIRNSRSTAATCRQVLLDAVARAARRRPRCSPGWRCTRVEQDEARRHCAFPTIPPARRCRRSAAAVAIACDGIHSAIRKQFFPDEGEPRYSGVNMWRGVTRWKPILSGASMVRAGWLATRQDGDLSDPRRRRRRRPPARQLGRRDRDAATIASATGTGPARSTISSPAFADWHFDWLDVPAFIRAADMVLEFPMVDQDPLPRWSFGRVTLLGDAAHPMVPRGSNGAGQAILDAARARRVPCRDGRPGGGAQGLRGRSRREATARIVLTNRTQSAGRDPARGLRAHRRPAVRAHRRRHQPRRARGDVGGLQADRRLRPGRARCQGERLRRARPPGSIIGPRPPRRRNPPRLPLVVQGRPAATLAGRAPRRVPARAERAS